MFSFHANLDMQPTSVILARRGLEEGGRVQQYIDSEVLRLSEPYTPHVTGTLSRSGAGSTVVGSGTVVWGCFYAPYQYYLYGDTRSYDPMRGGHWFERMKADHREEIVRGAQRMAGAI